MKIIITCFISLLLFTSFINSEDVSELTKQKMFCHICAKPNSTSHDQIVITVKNLKTSEIKDICTTINFLQGAFYRETGKLRFGLDCREYLHRYFEFAKDSALWNIGFEEYSHAELMDFQKKMNVDSIVRMVKAGKLTSINLPRMERLYFAHIMFNRGIITTTGCFGTSLYYFRQ